MTQAATFPGQTVGTTETEPESGPPSLSLTDPRMRIRLVLRVRDAGEIHRTAEQVSDYDAKNPHYGKYLTRQELARLGWGSPPAAAAQLRELLAKAGLEVSEIGPTLVIVTGRRSRVKTMFPEHTLERLDPMSLAALQLHAWEWGDALADFETLIRTLHLVNCEPTPAQTRRERRAQREAAQPVRGWTFAGLSEDEGARALYDGRDTYPAATGAPRIEDGVTPAMLRTLYGFPEALTGKGQTIAVMKVGSSTQQMRAALNADLQKFWGQFGVARKDVEFLPVGPQGNPEGAFSPLFRLEASMGPAWIGALVPEANVVIYELSQDLPDPWLAAIEQAVADEQHQPTVLCMTWTLPEEEYYRQFNRSAVGLALAKAAALGITVVAASGDWGVYDGRPGARVESEPSARVARAAWPHATFPSTEDRVLSVGGTLISATDPRTEIAWSGPLPPNPALAQALPFTSLATSGGFSQRVPIPDWQRDAVIGSYEQRIYSRGSNLPAVLPYGRGYPDVSLMAAGPSLARGAPNGLSATGYQLVIDGKWINYAGGTSMAAPIWASIVAAVNAERAKSHQPRLGFVNPALYYLARTSPLEGPNAVMIPINTGNSDIEFRVITGQGSTDHYVLDGYRAKSQWDPATGLGIPNVQNLAHALIGYPFKVHEHPPAPSSEAGIAAA